MDESVIAPDGIVARKNGCRIAEAPQQRLQFVAAAVNVANQIERAVFRGLVIPKRNAIHDGAVHLFRRFQHENMAEAFPSETTKRPP